MSRLSFYGGTSSLEGKSKRLFLPWRGAWLEVEESMVGGGSTSAIVCCFQSKYFAHQSPSLFVQYCNQYCCPYCLVFLFLFPINYT